MKYVYGLLLAAWLAGTGAQALEKPNIIIYFADDISARELPVYGSSVWTDPWRNNTSDRQYRAVTPVLDQMATDGCWIKTAWAACVCNPSRAMMMSGRYGCRTKWWNNKDKGWGPDETGKVNGTWPVYMSSPLLLGHIAQQSGYGTYWAGKTQMAGSWERHGFDEGCFTPESKKNFGLHTYGPDVELDFVFDFMDRKQKEGKPFFIYHTTHLGHAAWDWFDPEGNGQSWVGTPKIQWDGRKYSRTKPKITGDNGVYNTHGTVTEPGMHSHLNYIDYQLWQYRQKLDKIGISDNTVIIFAADNGTGGYGKNSGEKQKGCHIPMIIYAPGMTKHGQQDVLASVADILPTVAELIGFKIPADYTIDGESLVPFLFTGKPEHRDWIFTQRGPEQLIRGKKVHQGWS